MEAQLFLADRPRDGRTEGRTDSHKEQIIAFRNFEDVPESNWILVHFYKRKYSGANYTWCHTFDMNI
jgi:hypothetical protein